MRKWIAFLCIHYIIFIVREVLGLDDLPDESDNKELELPQFDLSVIVKATNDFSMENKLGEGGFGPVYKVGSYIIDYTYELGLKHIVRVL